MSGTSGCIFLIIFILMVVAVASVLMKKIDINEMKGGDHNALWNEERKACEERKGQR